jgi:hypothetical protein
VIDEALVFLDVDGPLIPFRARAGESATDQVAGNPLIGRLDPADGRRLLALGCQLVWATTWMADANELVAPRLGLPQLPVVEFPEEDDEEGEEPELGVHWKTASLVRWAAGWPFVWLDDEAADADRRWVRAHHPGRALLHRVDPFAGLTEADFSRVRRWLAEGVR